MSTTRTHTRPTRKAPLRGIDPRTEIVSQAASVVPFLIKTAVVGGIAYYLYYRYTNRFVKLKENGAYPAANVTPSQAEARAKAIKGAQGTFTTDFDVVANALSELNYNGFIRVYNAFGHQAGTLLAGDLNLVEWLQNQFTQYQVQQLSFLINGAFFRPPNTLTP